jgi:hypothetical protein
MKVTRPEPIEVPQRIAGDDLAVLSPGEELPTRVQSEVASGTEMSTTEVAFLSLLLSAIVCLLGGVGLTRLHWRPDLHPYGRQTRALDVALHPEKYVTGAPLRAIRCLNHCGAIFAAGAVGITVYEILEAMRLI